jgi:hypothetical protein
MRVDNGEPLGNSTGKMTPPLALWLIGHDIDMIWNQPYCPKQNAVVERMQDTSQRWTMVDSVENLVELRLRLKQEAHIQHQVFRVTRLKHKTRLESYPELLTGQRAWQPQSIEHFCEKRVYQFLERRTFVRKSSSAGQMRIFGKQFSLGKKKYKNISVRVKFCSEKLTWQVFHHLEKIKEFPANNLLKENILNFAVFE